MITAKQIAVSLLLTTATGCAATKGYDGSAPSGTDVASVRADGVTFHSVNGKPVGMMSHGLEVLPGKSAIVLTVNASNFNSRGPSDPTFLLEFQAEPGANYVVTGQRGDGRVCAWRINPDSGEPDTLRPAGCITQQR